jgi:hypothetical protein
LIAKATYLRLRLRFFAAVPLHSSLLLNCFSV